MIRSACTQVSSISTFPTGILLVAAGLARNGLEDRIQQPDISLQQRENRVLALRAERQRLLGLASHTTGMESLGHTVKAVQVSCRALLLR